MRELLYSRPLASLPDIIGPSVRPSRCTCLMEAHRLDLQNIKHETDFFFSINVMCKKFCEFVLEDGWPLVAD